MNEHARRAAMAMYRPLPLLADSSRCACGQLFLSDGELVIERPENRLINVSRTTHEY
jgi:hypothetical protein